jgi:hypothetical protein
MKNMIKPNSAAIMRLDSIRQHPEYSSISIGTLDGVEYEFTQTGTWQRYLRYSDQFVFEFKSLFGRWGTASANERLPYNWQDSTPESVYGPGITLRNGMHQGWGVYTWVNPETGEIIDWISDPPTRCSECSSMILNDEDTLCGTCKRAEELMEDDDWRDEDLLRDSQYVY